MKTVRLKTCADSMSAQIVQDVLKNAGIESFSQSENITALYPGIFEVDVFVMEDKYDQAFQVLKEAQIEKI